jgi:Flp pilus assembly protein TadD
MRLFQATMLVLVVALYSPSATIAQESDSSTNTRPTRRPAPGPTLGYGLGTDAVSERYLTSLEYQDLRLKKKNPDQPRDRTGRTQVPVDELAVPQKALEEAEKARDKRREGKPEEALKHLRKALEIHPRFARAYVQMGTILREMGKMVQAEQALLKAVEISPDSLGARKNLGYFYLATNRPDPAVAQLAEAARLEPTDVGAKAFLGDALFKAGRFRDAEITLKTALALDPTCYPAAYRLSALYAGQRKFPEAIALLEGVLKREHPGIETATLETLLTRLREMNP